MTSRRLPWLALLALAALAHAEAPDASVPKKPLRELAELKLLYFRADWCQSCKRFDAAGVLAEVQKREPALAVQKVNVDTEQALMDRYGIEVTPSLVLVDADGYPLARPKIALDDGPATVERILKSVRRSTGR